jgi:hypothetical protein
VPITDAGNISNCKGEQVSFRNSQQLSTYAVAFGMSRSGHSYDCSKEFRHGCLAVGSQTSNFRVNQQALAVSELDTWHFTIRELVPEQFVLDSWETRSGRLAAFAACGIFISVFSFSHLIGVGNYNYMAGERSWLHESAKVLAQALALSQISFAPIYLSRTV